MQNPNPAAEDHSTTNPTERFTTTDAVNPNPNPNPMTDAPGGGEVDFTGEGWSSAVVVAKKGRNGRGRPRSVRDKEDPLKGYCSVGARRKRVWKHTKCPCPVCEPSKKRADSTHRDDVEAGVVIDLNKVKEAVAEKTPMEGVDAAEEEKLSGTAAAAVNGSAMKGVENSEAEEKTESSEKEKRVVELGKEEGEGSSAANKDGHKKALAFDLNELPSEE